MFLPVDCVPCFVRNTLDAARRVTGDVKIHEHIKVFVPSFQRQYPIVLAEGPSSRISFASFPEVVQAARSLITSVEVESRAQWAQQKNCPPTSTPWPITRQLHCLQMGAMAWIAHSKLSKVCRTPAASITNALSYSLPQVSHFAIVHLPPEVLRDSRIYMCSVEELSRSFLWIGKL